MKVNVTYIVTYNVGRKERREKRSVLYEIDARWMRGESPSPDGRHLITQAIALQEKIRCAGTVSGFEIGPDDATAKKAREEASMISMLSHMQTQNRDTDRVRALERAVRKKYGLSYMHPLSWEHRREIEVAYTCGGEISERRTK